ncbi:3-hydroxyacyl-CoA dehydrogenase [Pararhodobacter marinus]|uniref:3-hydroxyacyl-CoA dehydrogenase n=3 Tax=Pararhodobacter marinus TaxID=2184063 RepID=UPI003515C7C6
MSCEDRLSSLAEVAGARDYLAQAVTLAGAVPAGAADPARWVRIGVLGAGAMGRGIAMAFAQTGRSVVLADPSAQSLDAARAHLAGLAARARKKGTLDEAGEAALMARFAFVPGVEGFAGCDLVVEAVPEILGLKQHVMAQIEGVVGPQALICTNTSTLDMDAIGSALADPSRFIGTHFFIPAQVNRLLEVIPAQATSAQTLADVLALTRALGKQAVVAANGDGFIGNRLFDRFHQEAMYLVEEGAWPEDVDAALEAWGMAIGPFRALDLVGNDIPWGVRVQRAERPVPPHQPRVGDALCEAGLYGQKTGRGWYLYDEATPKGRPYEEARALILRESQALGITRRTICPAEIVGRCVVALIVEGLAMLREGRAARASDIDMVYVTGYGFPAAKAGPMRLADELGLTEVLDLARHYGQISGRSQTVWALTEAAQ